MLSMSQPRVASSRIRVYQKFLDSLRRSFLHKARAMKILSKYLQSAKQHKFRLTVLECRFIIAKF
jgi:hypothetical protein